MAGPVGPVAVYLGFHVLGKMAQDQEEEEQDSLFDWAVDIDDKGVHVHKRSGKKTSGYRDDEVIVTGEETDEDVLSRWAKTEQSAAHAQRETAQPRQDEQQGFGGETIEEVSADVDSAIRRIRRANDLIPDEELSAQLYSIENSCSQILSILRQRPQLLPELRTFMRYYLPTTLKLLDARVKLDKNAATPKAREVRARISEALGVIDKAFLKQVEALDEYSFIDLESEMDVLRDMLRADGLVDDEPAAPAQAKQAAAPVYDPFADVMKKRSEKKTGGTPLAGH